MEWSPFHGMWDLHKQMGRLFDDFFHAPDFFGGRARPTVNGWMPAVEVREEDGNYVINVEIPGMKREDIQINLTDDVLSLSGERKAAGEKKDSNCVLREFSYGHFHRAFRLPGVARSKDVKASYKDGVLEIRLPMAEEAKTKTQKINIT